MRIGIDLGGTKIEVIALDDHGTELYRERVATPKDDYHAILQAITGLVQHAEQNTQQRGTIGVGIPGAISPKTKLVKNANTTCLIGQPLQRDLEQRLQRDVRLNNDANCFVVSEATDGAGKDGKVVFGVIIGTGTGGGIAIARTAVLGRNAIAGEWGHNPLPWPQADELPGPGCYCGKQGCIETFLSGPGFVQYFHSLTGKSLHPADVVALAANGDTVAETALQRYEDRLARALASVINIIDPDVIVLGGGMSNIPRLYSNVPKIWGGYVFSDEVTTPLRPPVHGDSSGVRGAAWLWQT